ncbi:CBS domain-containing protein [Aquihabitans sp. G128]|uniref:CBS domain-containing protein n=1 Tax=Aquihabitans sp. G128 TaxID=2849779 RepID=UPI001C22581D|nr:CBS domain-containing protein [Aquihabitans sp. G128]QXC61676.1 CBS domain-containing protein [Aquihabitans sp. G128]
MQVSIVLQGKGAEVVTVKPRDQVAAVLAVLAEHHIGAVIVSADGQRIDGICSERDIVRALAGHGAAVLDATVDSLMTTRVVTCQPDTTVEELMATMTDHRIRHVPVVVEGSLAGVVSIGDVVKDRIAALEHETQVLHDYIANPF